MINADRSLNVGIHGPYFNDKIFENRNEGIFEKKKYPDQAIVVGKKIELSGMDHLETLLADTEKELEIAGGIVGISTLSGPIRSTIGLVQTISALAFGFIGLFGYGLTSGSEKNEWEKFNNRAVYHIKEGVKNIFRGITEAIPIINTLWWIVIPHRNKLCDNDLLHRLTGTATTIETASGPKEVVCMRAYYEGELKRMHNEPIEKAEAAKKSIEVN